MSNHRPGFVGEPLQWVDVDDFEVQPASSASGGTTEQNRAINTQHNAMQRENINRAAMIVPP